MKLPSDRKIPYYSRGPRYLDSIIKQMDNNFKIYFKTQPERDIDWEWHDGSFFISFAGGETASHPFPRVAMCKAAISTPYLWDSCFDWREGKKCDNIDQKFISHIFNQLAPMKDQK
jgi:hypothetical protein